MTADDMEAELTRRVELEDMRDLAATDAGKRLFTRLFRDARCLDSVYKHNAEVYHLAGVQGFMIGVWRELHAANPDASLEIFDAIMAPSPIVEEE